MLTWRDYSRLDDLTLFSLLGVTVAIVAALWSAGHALLHKRDPRSALVWVSISLTIPVIGAISYWLLGINRITRKAHRLHRHIRNSRQPAPPHPVCSTPHSAAPLSAQLPARCASLVNLEVLTDRVVTTRTSDGNQVEVLINGEQAYPAMLDAIKQATGSVHLCSYIFDGDQIGAAFVEALAAAAQRGVAVRVLVDAMGERYSSLTVRKALQGSAAEVRQYLPLYKAPFINLRNHRKLLVTDGALAFTGGMNIRSNHCVTTADPSNATSDLHFQVTGPVVADLQRAFLEDWYFVTGQNIQEPHYFPPLVPCGNALVRVIADGPDREFRKLEWIIQGALATAARRIRIMTPYFIPDRTMITSLITAALRGIEITIILPQQNNLPFVAWASRASYWELVKNGITILEQPPPFAHSKLLLVDDLWCLVGSANLDTRSLRLNFELNLSIFDRTLAATLNAHIDQTVAQSRAITLQEMDSRPLPIKLRDSTARLFSPYL